MDYKIIAGCLLIMYGIVKIAFLMYELTSNNRKTDKTFAGMFLLLVLLAFGLYSFLHGIGILIYNSRFGEFIHSTSTLGVVYIVFGVTLIELYTLIAYTSLPISKDTTQINKYKLVGIGGGIIFLMALNSKLLWDKVRGKQLPNSLDFNIWVLLLWFIVLFSCLLAVLIESRSIFKGNGVQSELASLAALFLNANVG